MRVAPEDLKAVRDAVRETSGPIGITGAGTAADWAGALGPVDVVLDTSALTGVLVHNPGDMTVAVRAGTPLRALAAELAPHGQHVAFDAARVAQGATVGGLVATADAGPAALVHGSLRDLVIGATLVLADGTVARTGGHVIKNVAGYDLTKVVHGSYGTLAVLVEVVLRLHPVPRGSATIALPCTLAEAAQHAAAVLAEPHEPVALEWVAGPADGGSPDGSKATLPPDPGVKVALLQGATRGGELLVRIEGTPEALDERTARLQKLLGADVRADPGDVWERHASAVRGTPDAAVMRIGARPSRLVELLDALPASTVAAGLGTGVATVCLPPDAVAQAHRTVRARGGTSMVRARPSGVDVPALGPPPSAVGVLRGVKQAFDPDGRFGPGRFGEWA